MSHIIKRIINNTTYVYEESSYRDRNGKPRTKQRCLGKLNENGELISKKKLCELPSEILQVQKIITKYRVGKKNTNSSKD